MHLPNGRQIELSSNKSSSETNIQSGFSVNLKKFQWNEETSHFDAVFAILFLTLAISRGVAIGY